MAEIFVSMIACGCSPKQPHGSSSPSPVRVIAEPRKMLHAVGTSNSPSDRRQRNILARPVTAASHIGNNSESTTQEVIRDRRDTVQGGYRCHINHARKSRLDQRGRCRIDRRSWR